MAHPTTAGVLASFASLGDVLVAEPGALLSFTGPRVVQQTTREKLPEDFGLAERTSVTATSTRSSRDPSCAPPSRSS
jgi:acetyl-CoA carboxylase beta subunit